MNIEESQHVPREKRNAHPEVISAELAINPDFIEVLIFVK